MNGQRQESTIRVILLDALGLFRASLGRFLVSAGFEVSGEYATSAEVLDFLKNSTADVILCWTLTFAGSQAISCPTQDGPVLRVASWSSRERWTRQNQR